MKISKTHATLQAYILFTIRKGGLTMVGNTIPLHEDMHMRGTLTQQIREVFSL